jgi:hypothetical protein
MLLKGPGASRLTGEIGILGGIRVSDVPLIHRFFLYMHHEESSYLGCLLIEDHAFRSQILKLLQDYCNRPFAEIGSIDLAHTL